VQVLDVGKILLQVATREPAQEPTRLWVAAGVKPNPVPRVAGERDAPVAQRAFPAVAGPLVPGGEPGACAGDKGGRGSASGPRLRRGLKQRTRRVQLPTPRRLRFLRRPRSHRHRPCQGSKEKRGG
jgi:hypothetical protein